MERSRRHFGLWKLRELGISRMDRPEGRGGGRAYLFAIIYTERLFCFPQPFTLSSPVFFFVTPGGAFDIAARLYCLRPSTSFVSILDKTKENHCAHTRSLAATEFICIMGCSLLSCSTLRHIAIISAALLSCSITFFCFPRYLLWSIAQSLFVSRGGFFVTPARFLLSLNLESFCFNPEKNKRKSLMLACAVPASYCLANVIFCFQAKSSEFA